MKVLAISVCKNGVSDNIQLLLDSMFTGMKEKGAEIEQIQAENLDIKPCRACTNEIDYKSDGTCKCEDDMQILLPKLRESDVWVFADSVYNKSLSHELVNILDRMEPLFNPQESDVLTIKIQKKNKKVAFVSVTKDFEIETFSKAVSHFKSISKVFNLNFAGSLLRPHSWAMQSVDNVNGKVSDVVEAAKEAGRQLIVRSKISGDIQKAVSRELVPKKSFINKLGNLFL